MKDSRNPLDLLNQEPDSSRIRLRVSRCSGVIGLHFDSGLPRLVRVVVCRFFTGSVSTFGRVSGRPLGTSRLVTGLLVGTKTEIKRNTVGVRKRSSLHRLVGEGGGSRTGRPATRPDVRNPTSRPQPKFGDPFTPPTPGRERRGGRRERDSSGEGRVRSETCVPVGDPRPSTRKGVAACGEWVGRDSLSDEGTGRR